MITQQTLETELAFQRQQQQQHRVSMEQATVLFHQTNGIIFLLESFLKKLREDAAAKGLALGAMQNGAVDAPIGMTQEQLGELLGGRIESITPVNG